MNKFEVKNTLISFNKNNSYNKIPKLISYLKSGKSLALVSDAGMPSIFDPGEDFVKIAKENDIDVIASRPCAALTALVQVGCLHQVLYLKDSCQKEN